MNPPDTLRSTGTTSPDNVMTPAELKSFSALTHSSKKVKQANFRGGFQIATIIELE
jgi:hypothetical protein